jgi:hypothetical protein
VDLRARKSRRQARRPFPPPEPGQEFIVFKSRVARGGLVNPAPFDGRTFRVPAVLHADAPEPTNDVVQARDVRFARVEAAAGLLDGRTRRGRTPSPYPDVYALRGRGTRDRLVPELLDGAVVRTRPPVVYGEPDEEVPHHYRRAIPLPPPDSLLEGRVTRTRFLIEDPPAVVGNRPRATQVATLVPIEIIAGSGRVRRGRAFPDPDVATVPVRRFASTPDPVEGGRTRRGLLFHTGEEGPTAPCPERPPVIDESPTAPAAVEAEQSRPPVVEAGADAPPKFVDECR